MEFEYDPRKSESNLAKHGIDFDEARSLWDDPERMEFAAISRGEPRWGILSRYAGSCWVAIYTLRGGNIRMISVRRATAKEASRYDRARNDR